MIKEKLIGLTLEEAKKLDMEIRVVKSNGEALLGTRDYRKFRVNVAVKDGVICEIINLG